jgi:hypothetical protein
MLINRRQLGATAIGGLLAAHSAPLFAQGAKVSLKVGGQFQASHPASMAMEEACADIRKQSGASTFSSFPMPSLARMLRC